MPCRKNAYLKFNHVNTKIIPFHIKTSFDTFWLYIKNKINKEPVKIRLKKGLQYLKKKNLRYRERKGEKKKKPVI